MKVFKLVLVISALFILSIYLFLNFRKKPSPQFSVEKCSQVVLTTGKFFKYSKELDEILINLPTGHRSIWHRPDHVLLLYRKTSSDPEYLSIFLKDGFIYEGYYLEAWTDRMNNEKSLVYIMSKDQVEKVRLILERD